MNCRFLALTIILSGSLDAQEVTQVQLDTLTPAIHTVQAAAPTEGLSAGTPGSGYVATRQLAYTAWLDVSRKRIRFSRSADGGDSWSSPRTLHTASGSAVISPRMKLHAEGHNVVIVYHTNESGHNSPWNVYAIGSARQGLGDWTLPYLVNATTAGTGSSTHYPQEVDSDFTVVPAHFGKGLSWVPRAYMLHVVYEFGDNRTTSTYQGLERPYYTRIWFGVRIGLPATAYFGTTVAERQVSSVHPRDNEDIDTIRVFAKGLRVLMMYRSDRFTYTGPGTSVNRLYATFSTDGGDTFARDFPLGAGVPSLNTGNGKAARTTLGWHAPWTYMAVGANNLYFFWEDATHGFSFGPRRLNYQQVGMTWSTDGGRTWTSKILTRAKPGLVDIDGIDVVALDNRVCVLLTSDERGEHRSLLGSAGELTNTPCDRTVAADNKGSGNYTNQIQFYLSEDEGRTFSSRWLSNRPIDDGSVSATRGLTGTLNRATLKGTNFINCKNAQMEMRFTLSGIIIHVAYEEEWYNGVAFQGEDLTMISSNDGGRTWSRDIDATMGASRSNGFHPSGAGATSGYSDIDTPHMAITIDGRAICAFRQAKPHGAADRPQVVTRRIMSAAYRNSLSIRNDAPHTMILDAGIDNRFREYLIAGALRTAPGFNLGSVYVPLYPDAYTDLTIALANTKLFSNFRGTLDKWGRAKATVKFSALKDPTIIGLKLFHAFVLFDKSGNVTMASNPVRMVFTK